MIISHILSQFGTKALLNLHLSLAALMSIRLTSKELCGVAGKATYGDLVREEVSAGQGELF